MTNSIRRGAVALLALVVVIASLRSFVAPLIERLLNRVILSPPYQLRESTKSFHKQLLVADLHADALLWNRDLLQRSSYGHVDMPRLVEGNVALQVFAAATKIPIGINFERNPSRGDLLVALTMVQTWPPRTWFSLLQRALYQAEKLRAFARRSPDQLLIVSNTTDLEDLVARRERQADLVGAVLALEGVHALEGKISNLQLLYEAGFRMIGLSHFHDNEAGGSAHGILKGGLTPFGKTIVRHVKENGMMLDLSHASARVIDDVLDMDNTAPLVVSHTGVKGVCDNQRNISDDHVRGIAATGGIIGIAFFEKAVCGNSIKDAAISMRYVADLVGVEHVAIGTDYDGAIAAPMDVSGMGLLTEVLLEQGFSVDEVAKIMGGNVFRVLRATLPSH